MAGPWFIALVVSVAGPNPRMKAFERAGGYVQAQNPNASPQFGPTCKLSRTARALQPFPARSIKAGKGTSVCKRGVPTCSARVFPQGPTPVMSITLLGVHTGGGGSGGAGGAHTLYFQSPLHCALGSAPLPLDPRTQTPRPRLWPPARCGAVCCCLRTRGRGERAGAATWRAPG